VSSARGKDALQLSHWERAAAEFPDYPFARFNKKIDIVRYTDDDYQRLLAAPADASAGSPDARWTREMTDALFDLCRRYDLRWPVIRDRFPWRSITVEELKQRFYTVMARVIRARINAMPQHTKSAITGTQYTDFNYTSELDGKRRRHVHAAYTKSKPERILQERLLLDELRVIDERLEELRAAAHGSTLATSVMAEALTSRSLREQELAARPTPADVPPPAAGLAPAPASSSPSSASSASSSSSAAAVAAAAATAAAAGPVLPAADQAQVDVKPVIPPTPHGALAQLAPAKEGRPRGGGSAWSGKTSCLDAWAGVRLRSEQLCGIPDGGAHSSKLLAKVTALLGELGVPLAGKMHPSAATLSALTVLRRQCAALMRLQQAVELRERTVMALQLTRKTMALVPLGTADPIEILEKQRASARREAAAAAAAAAAASGAAGAMAAGKAGAASLGAPAAALDATRSRAAAAAASSIGQGSLPAVAKNASGGITIAAPVAAGAGAGRKRGASGGTPSAKRQR